MVKPFIVVGNWKMHKTYDQALEFVHSLPPLIVPNFLAVPYPYLAPLAQLNIPMLQIGAQNLHPHQEGAFTGEVSASMIRSTGAEFVLVGHSERRHQFNESNSFINRKLKAALVEGLMPILCIGETALEREEGRTFDVLKTMLSESLQDIESKLVSKIMVAYEPIWAIGTGLPATAQAAQEVHFMIRKWFKEKYSESLSDHLLILYGGSVTDETMPDLMKQTDINGVLVGGASLKPDSYSKIIACVGGHS